MGRAPELTRNRWTRARLSRGSTAVLAVFLSGGCAVFGGTGGEAGTPGSPADPSDGPTPAAAPADTILSPPANGTMEERMLAGDWEGVVALYTADSTLHKDEEATYRAALASAMSGHDAHDPRAAERRFRRLLEEHPDTTYRLEVELFLDLLTREQELRATVDRLDRELQQLKAIDLGQEPVEQP